MSEYRRVIVRIIEDVIAGTIMVGVGYTVLRVMSILLTYFGLN